MKYQLGVCAAVLLGSVSTAALADDPTYGPYISVGIGPAFEEDVTATGLLNNTDVSFDTGFSGIGALGWGFGNGFRAEIEGGWHQNDASNKSFTQTQVGQPFSSSSGRATQQTLLFNLLYDFDTGTPWTPHLGFGIGLDSARIDNINVPPTNNPVNTHELAFGYQAIAGIEYAIAPGFHVGLEYRYLGTSEIDLTTAGNAADNGTIKSSYNLGTHNILATMRFNFGEAPAPLPSSPPPPPLAPPPPPPPQVEAQREFQVFFDFDKSDITAAAAKVLQAAADTVKAGHVAHIIVTGHTDTVGSAKYNQGLSERRAGSVKAQLIADGVDGGEIATRGVGKTDLLVPTKDGVREPQNRRATIDLQ